MRLWKFLVGMVIITGLSIWGCAAIINTPEKLNIEVPFNSIIMPDGGPGANEYHI